MWPQPSLEHVVHLKCNTFHVRSVAASFAFIPFFFHFCSFFNIYEFHFFAFSVYYHDFYANQQNILTQSRDTIRFNSFEWNEKQ